MLSPVKRLRSTLAALRTGALSGSSKRGKVQSSRLALQLFLVLLFQPGYAATAADQWGICLSHCACRRSP
jgi:hypothetical protein